MNKSTQTKTRRSRFLKQYAQAAKDNRLRFNYNKVRELDLKAGRENKSFKQVFNEHLEKSYNNKTYYLSKKFKINKADAKELLKVSLLEGLTYRESYERIKEAGHEFTRITRLVDAIPMLRDNFNDRPFNIELNFPFMEKWEGTPDEFVRYSIQFRSDFEAGIQEYFGDEGINIAYPEVEDIINVEYDNFESLATTAKVSLANIDFKKFVPKFTPNK